MLMFRKKVMLLVILFLAIGLPGGAMIFFQMLDHHDPVNVVWDIKTEPEYIVSSAPAPARTKKSKSDRMPASNPGATFVIENGVKKLVIKLHYLCSSWLYLSKSSLNGQTPATVNANECLIYAAGATAATQLIYDNSRIPVKFTYTYGMDLAAYSNMNGTFNSYNEMSARISTTYSDPNFYTSAVNTNTDYANPYIMPSIRILNLESQLVHQAAMTTVDQNPAHITPIPTYQNGYLVPNYPNCGSPTSTTPIYNFDKTWGITREQWLAFRLNGKAICGYNGCPITQRKDDFTGKCVVQCTCMHLYGTSFAWDSQGCKLPQNGPGGPWPGNPSDILQINRCGYPLVASPEYWVSTATTPYPIHYTNYVVQEEGAVFNWLYRNRSNGYMPAAGEYKILVAVRPYGTSDSNNITNYGTAAALVDIDNGWIIGDPSIGGVTNERPSPQDYLKKYGAVVVNRSAPDWTTLGHEIGHILGGWHELSSIGTNSNPYFQPPYLKSRKLGAFSGQFGLYFTVMHSYSGFSINYFSTRSFKDNYNLPLGVDEDNRAQVVKSISYLAGENLETVKTPEQKASILQMILKLLTGE